ncbi:MAG: hypothetical protein IH867_07625 [Chloroflexi bacterium]|nr:hypothetical protein [Chloroflexota bacterium]
MRNSALRAGAIGVVAIVLAAIGSQLIERSDGSEVPDFSNISKNRSSQGLTELEQGGGSFSRAGVSSSIDFVVRNADGEIIDSGSVSGD